MYTAKIYQDDNTFRIVTLDENGLIAAEVTIAGGEALARAYVDAILAATN